MKLHRKKATLLGCLVGLGVMLWTQNNWLQVEQISYRNERIPPSFAGYRIAHVSDLHNHSFGAEQKRLVAALSKMRPDLIVITGDLIDTAAHEAALTFARQAVDIAPVYYVTGNHELRYAMQEVLGEKLSARGVRVLQDETVFLTRGQDTISLTGVNDPAYFVPLAPLAGQSEGEVNRDTYRRENELRAQRETALSEMLAYLQQETASTPFSILLAHHPEYLPLYDQAGFSLVFAGHAHGGQIRIPFVGPVLSPGQGLFPPYTAGLYTAPLGHTDLIVSRGLGNSAFPLRINNRPHLILATLNP